MICSHPIELAQSMQKLKELISLKIVGGCCGTDHTPINEIANVMSSVVRGESLRTRKKMTSTL
ncbi:homocysteine S-methyltransferase family protein [Gorillibacterium timonense]|uniref:homocysteine S-methyltransferase family protein n=1 Tax=Gorillibacterium timonense TaxID=1689269 RepID=UPI003709943F